MENSPLARLPAELRTSIYETALVQEKPISLSKRPISKSEIPSFAALLQTCRQIRTEATAVFYSSKSFLIRTGCGFATNRCLGPWLDTMELRTRGLLRRIFVDEFMQPIGFDSNRHDPNRKVRRLVQLQELLREKGLVIDDVEVFWKGCFCDWIKWE